MISSEREKRILRYGSPLFSYKNPALVSNQSWVLDYETMIPQSQKYLPFNFLNVINNGEGDIEIWFDDNPENKKTIPANTIMTFENIWFRKLRVVNISVNTISQNRIEFTAQRLPLSDELARTTDIPIIQKIKLLFG